MKTIKLSILLLFACTLAIAQSSLNSITLTNAITDTNTEQITLSSMAAVNVGDLLFVDREAMKVVRVGLVTVSVIRGSNSRAAIHAAGATVLSGSPDKFFSYDPPAGGPCTATALPVTPLVNISNGNQWTCTNGIYVQSAGAGGATHWGAVLGTLSDQTDLQTALNGKVGTARTVNGHALSANVAVTYGDLGVIPAADLPNPGASSLGGVQSKDCSSVGLVQKINTDGTVTCAVAGPAIAPSAFASIGACSTTSFLKLLSDSYYNYAYCDGASALSYFMDGKQAFPPAAASNWTVVNGASGTAAKADSAGAVTLSTVTSVNGVEAILKATPAAPYTKTIAVRHQSYLGTGGGGAGDINGCGVLWTNGTTTSSSVQYERFETAGNSAPYWYLIVAHATNFTYTSVGTDTLFPGVLLSGGTIWYQLIDDNTSRTMKISMDGINFRTIYGPTARTSPFTPTNYGVWCGAQGGVTTAGTPWSISLLSDN